MDGVVWSWTVSGSRIIARNAETRERAVAEWDVVERLQAEFGRGAWGDVHERNMVEPRHVAGWLRDRAGWVSSAPEAAR